MTPLIVFKFLAQVSLAVIILASLFHWVRTGFWVPKYIHFIALAMLLIAVLLAYMAYSINDENAFKSICLVVGFPIAVYIIYGLYGGGINSKDIKINEGLAIDRQMLKEEVIEILKQRFWPLTKLSFETLLILSQNEENEEIVSKSGKSYLFQVSGETCEGEEGETIVGIYGMLTEYKRKLYKPKCHVAFELGKSGRIYRNGINP